MDNKGDKPVTSGSDTSVPTLNYLDAANLLAHSPFGSVSPYAHLTHLPNAFALLGGIPPYHLAHPFGGLGAIDPIRAAALAQSAMASSAEWWHTDASTSANSDLAYPSALTSFIGSANQSSSDLCSTTPAFDLLLPPAVSDRTNPYLHAAFGGGLPLSMMPPTTSPTKSSGKDATKRPSSASSTGDFDVGLHQRRKHHSSSSNSSSGKGQGHSEVSKASAVPVLSIPFTSSSHKKVTHSDDGVSDNTSGDEAVFKAQKLTRGTEHQTEDSRKTDESRKMDGSRKQHIAEQIRLKMLGKPAMPPPSRERAETTGKGRLAKAHTSDNEDQRSRQDLLKRHLEEELRQQQLQLTMLKRAQALKEKEAQQRRERLRVESDQAPALTAQDVAGAGWSGQRKTTESGTHLLHTDIATVDRANSDDSDAGGSSHDSNLSELEPGQVFHDEWTGEKRCHQDVGGGSTKKQRIVDETELRIPLELGWRRETRLRETEMKGLVGEVLYYTPCSRKLRLYQEVEKYIEKSGITDLTRENFSFSARYNVGDFLEYNSDTHNFVPLNEEEVPERLLMVQKKRGRPPKYMKPDQEVPMQKSKKKLLREQKRMQKKYLKKLEKQNSLAAAQKAKQMKERKKQKQRILLLKQHEKLQKQEQMRVDREIKAQQIIEARRRRREEIERSRIEEAIRRAQSNLLWFHAEHDREMKRQQGLILKEQERERRRQHLLLVKALEARRRQVERVKMKEEKRVEKIMERERKLESRRLELQMAEEMRIPRDDLELTDHKALPDLTSLDSMSLSGSSMADLIMVVEFLNTFGDALNIDSSHFMTLEQLQRAVLHQSHHDHDRLITLLLYLIQSAIGDPGVPNPKEAMTSLNQKLTDIVVNEVILSEILRIFIRARNGCDSEITRLLADHPLETLRPDQMSSILAFLCNELLSSKRIMTEIDNNIDNITTLRKDRWVIEGKVRKLRVVQCKKFNTSETRFNSGDAPADISQNASGVMKRESDDDDSGNEMEAQMEVACNQSDDDEPTTNEECEKRIEKLQKQHSTSRKKVFDACHKLRGICLGEDRYRRTYWLLPHCGGVFVEGMDTGHMDFDKYDPNKCPFEDGNRAGLTGSDDCGVIATEGSRSESSEKAKMTDLTENRSGNEGAVVAGNARLLDDDGGADSGRGDDGRSENRQSGGAIYAAEKTEDEIVEINAKRNGCVNDDDDEMETSGVSCKDEVVINSRVKSELSLLNNKDGRLDVELSECGSGVLTRNGRGFDASSLGTTDISHESSTTDGRMLASSNSAADPFLDRSKNSSHFTQDTVPKFASQFDTEKVPRVKDDVNTETRPNSTDFKSFNGDLSPRSTEISTSQGNQAISPMEFSFLYKNDSSSNKSNPTEHSKQIKIEKFNNVTSDETYDLNDFSSNISMPYTNKLNELISLANADMSDASSDISTQNASVYSPRTNRDCSTPKSNFRSIDSLLKKEPSSTMTALCNNHFLPQNLIPMGSYTTETILKTLSQQDASYPWFSILPRVPCGDDKVPRLGQIEAQAQISASVVGMQMAADVQPTQMSAVHHQTSQYNQFYATPISAFPSFHLGQLTSPESFVMPPFIASQSFIDRFKVPSTPDHSISTSSPIIFDSLRDNLRDPPHDPPPIPQEFEKGWWKITNTECLQEVMKCLHPRGIKEKQLCKNIQRYFEFASIACARSVKLGKKENCDENDDESLNESKDADLTEAEIFAKRTFDMEMMTLEEVENLEDRVFSASLQMKGCKIPPRISELEGVQLVNQSVKCLNNGQVYPLELARQRLAELEKCIERRYIKPPLSKCIRMSLASMTGEHHGDEEYDETPGAEGENVAHGLVTWRRVLTEATSPAKVALCAYQLAVAIAWDKSIMKVLCQLCRKDDNEAQLLLCDSCDRGYHTYCFKPEMANIPEGDWYCFECISKVTGVSHCIVCGQKGGRIVECNTCPRAIHTDCHSPAMPRVPKRWLCEHCINDSGRKKRRCLRRQDMKLHTDSLQLSPEKIPRESERERRGSNTSLRDRRQSREEGDVRERSTEVAERSSEGERTSEAREKSEVRERSSNVGETSSVGKETSLDTTEGCSDARERLEDGVERGDAMDECGDEQKPENGSAETQRVGKAASNAEAKPNKKDSRKRSADDQKKRKERKRSKRKKKEPEKEKGGDETKVENNREVMNGGTRSREKVMMSEADLNMCRLILTEMERHEMGAAFKPRINLKKLPQYKKVIKRPMSFSVMASKLRERVYKCCEDFAEDTRLIFNNCETFNEDDSEIGIAGHTMRRYFETRWAELRRTSPR